MTRYKILQLAALCANLPGHLKRATSPAGIRLTQPYTPPQPYIGDTTSPEFFNTVAETPEGVTVTPSQVLRDAYKPRDTPRYGRVTRPLPRSWWEQITQQPAKSTTTLVPDGYTQHPSTYPEVLSAARRYREENPTYGPWLQNLDDRVLNRPVPVTRHEDPRSGGTYYHRQHRATIPTDPKDLDRNNETLQHEVGTHAAQDIPLFIRYDEGLAPTTRQRLRHRLIDDARFNAVYQLDPVEIEARLRHLQRDARINRTNMINAGRPLEDVEDVEDPANARIRLERALRGPGWGPPRSLDGLSKAFKKLTPEQQEHFLDLWSRRLPGLVQNTTPRSRYANTIAQT